LLVAPRAELPDRCVKCNVAHDVQKKTFRLAWSPGWSYILFVPGVLLGLLPGALVLMLFQRKLSVQIGVCRRHVSARRKAILYAWIGSIAAVGLMIYGFSLDNSTMIAVAVPAGVGFLLASLVYGIVGARIVWPKRIHDDLAWLKGASPEYLAALPEFTQLA
jgi:hypothetical protein